MKQKLKKVSFPSPQDTVVLLNYTLAPAMLLKNRGPMSTKENTDKNGNIVQSKAQEKAHKEDQHVFQCEGNSPTGSQLKHKSEIFEKGVIQSIENRLTLVLNKIVEIDEIYIDLNEASLAANIRVSCLEETPHTNHSDLSSRLFWNFEEDNIQSTDINLDNVLQEVVDT